MRVVRDIKTLRVFQDALEVLMDDWWNKQGVSALGETAVTGVTGAALYGAVEDL